MTTPSNTMADPNEVYGMYLRLPPIILYSTNSNSALSITRLARKIPQEGLGSLEDFVAKVEDELGGKGIKYALTGALSVGVIGLYGVIANYVGANLSKDCIDAMTTLGGISSIAFGWMHFYGNVDTYFARKRISERKNNLL